MVETSDVAAFSDLDCKRLGDGRLKIIVEDSSKALAILSDKRTVINDFDYVKANINDVFLNITGREMA